MIKTRIKLNVFLLFIAFLGIISCTPPPLDVNLPLLTAKPVVAVQFGYDSVTEQSVVLITLSRSLSAKDGKIPTVDSSGNVIGREDMIEHAEMNLTVGGIQYPCTEVESGIYAAFNVIMNGNEWCTISARDASGQKLMNAVTQSTTPVRFNQVWLNRSGNVNVIHYELQDNPATRDWYVVNYLVKQKQDSTRRYTDPVYIAKRLTEQRLDFDLFSDKDFQSNRLQITRTVDDPEADTIGIALSHIDEGFFNFLTAQKRQGLLVNQLRSEVINFPTNIEGGYGYFSMHSPKLEVLVVKQ